jgi:D-alanyl-D-alanine carboxypeptidase
MIVNKTFGLPSDYAPGLDSEASEAFNSMAAQAWSEGITLWICSGYRSYSEQETLFEGYASQRGLSEADSVSARPGYSEHQSGLCMDVNTTDFSFAGTAEAQWLEEHCAEYGFIIRFPEGKESITGYEYEPWHIRYVGVEAAQAIMSQGLCLEEYLNVTSDYADSPDNEKFLQQYSEYAN